MAKLIKTEIRDSIQIIELSCSDKLNELSTAMLAEIATTLETAAVNDKIDCTIIYGGQKSFSCGSDISEMLHKTSVDVYYDERTKYWNRIYDYQKPLLAAVNRLALGSGFELALMCDYIVASSDAVFGSPEVNLGLIPGASGTVILPDLIGRMRAFEWLATGDQKSAEELLQLGLVNKIVDGSQTLDCAIEFGRLLAKKSRLSIMFIKESLRHSSIKNITQARKQERMLFSLIFSSANAQEGIKAYVEKRKAEFKN